MSRDSPVARSARSAPSPKLAAAVGKVRVRGLGERPGTLLERERRRGVANLGFKKMFRGFKLTPLSTRDTLVLVRVLSLLIDG